MDDSALLYNWQLVCTCYVAEIDTAGMKHCPRHGTVPSYYFPHTYNEEFTQQEVSDGSK